MESGKKEIRRRAGRILLSTVGIGGAALILVLLGRRGIGIPCVFHKLTGLLCPGCGNTRAAIAMVRLDFAEAFRCNPLSFLEFFYIGWVYLWAAAAYIRGKGFSYRPPVPVLDVVILVLIVLWGILRNLI